VSHQGRDKIMRRNLYW